VDGARERGRDAEQREARHAASLEGFAALTIPLLSPYAGHNRKADTGIDMKRVALFVAVAALVFPTLAVAVTSNANDGTLSLKDGRGTFIVNAKGGVIGSFAKGKVFITDPIEGDGTGPIVSLSGDDWHKDRGETTDVYGGTKIRFRLIGGAFKIRVIGRGVNLSVVGRGQATVNGEGTLDDGSYSVNGSDYQPVPLDPFTFTLNVLTTLP
jgi:hypothetical protein